MVDINTCPYFFYEIRWYILIGSFVIFPLTFNVGLGCRFLNVGYENQDEIQSIGAFTVAIYDPQTRGNNNFLGCVKPSQFWQEETSYDVGFTTIRVACAFMLAFTIVATLICVCLQCFNKHGKSHLWGIMRICYIGAAISQAAMYSVFASDMCKDDYDEEDDDSFKGFLLFNLGDKKCAPGQTGILGMVNFALLVGMVVASFNSLPPRNPVFQCWGGDIDWDEESEDGSTSEEDSDLQRMKSMESADDSVSLFSSRKSRKSFRASGKDEAESVAEKGFSGHSVASKSIASVVSKKEKYALAEEGSVKSKQSKPVEIDEMTVGSKSTAKSKSKIPGIGKFFQKKKSETTDIESVASTKKSATKLQTVDEIKPESNITSEGSQLGDILNTMSSAGLNTMSSALSCSSGATLEITNFVIQLIEMTELEAGGRRVKMADNDNEVEIIDEYPKVPGGEIVSSDSDVAVVRTEFYDLGSRTIKTITHKDGSKTIVTTIVVEHGSTESIKSVQMSTAPPPTYPKLLEPPVEKTYSVASIESQNSSKYNITAGPSSVTTYKGTGKKKDMLGQGDLALSVGTTSVKSVKK